MAKQAGMPPAVVARAKDVISDLATPTEAVLPSLTPAEKPLNKTQILQHWAQSLNVENMTQKQVFDLVYSLAQEEASGKISKMNAVTLPIFL